jgi:hypothetical protein
MLKNKEGMCIEGEDSRLVQVDIPGLKAWKLGKILKNGRKVYIFCKVFLWQVCCTNENWIKFDKSRVQASELWILRSVAEYRPAFLQQVFRITNWRVPRGNMKWVNTTVEVHRNIQRILRNIERCFGLRLAILEWMPSATKGLFFTFLKFVSEVTMSYILSVFFLNCYRDAPPKTIGKGAMWC